MHKAPNIPHGPVLCLSTVLAMVYTGLASIWAIWTFCTLRFRTLEEEAAATEPLRMLSTGQYTWVSVANFALALYLISDAHRVRREPPPTRRAFWAGIGMALLILVAVQVGAHYAHAPFPRPS
jgi:L-asparagine transporter-like permease